MRRIDTDVCVCVSITKWHPAKMAGLIEMPFGMWGGVGPGNYVLDGGLDPRMGRSTIPRIK